TEIVAPASAASVPLVGEIVIQLALLVRFQVRVLVPEFVTVKNAGLGANGPPTGPVEDKTLGLICKKSGTSNASTNPDVVELPGELALAPIPRLANAAHSRPRFAPPLSTWSACMMASRACKKVGFAGDRFI